MHMRVAIAGAGLAGLGVAWHLCSLGIDVVLFDGEELSPGASSMAAGLLHPFAGRKCRLNPRGREGFAATRHLLKQAEAALGSAVFRRGGLMRIPIDSQQADYFRKSAMLYPELEWRDKSLFIASALVVDCPKYLLGLKASCQQRGVVIIKEKVTGVSDLLKEAPIAVVATGASLLNELGHLPLSTLKGQLLQLTWPQGLSPLSCPISGEEVYLLPLEKGCLLGATFERHYSSLEPDEAGKSFLLSRGRRLSPALTSSAVTAAKAALRVSTPGHLPYYRQLGPKLWLATGLGSKGLLYHALYGSELAHTIKSVRS